MKREPPSTTRAIDSFDAPLEVLIVNRQRAHTIRRADITRVLRAAAAELHVHGELAVVFAGNALLHRLNRDYRFKDKPTDVLSFPSEDGDLGLGDVVISVETARTNAKRYRRTLDRELEILALHGLLHVLGYDHETDDGEMEALEKKLRARFLTKKAAA
jgi:probable rRNA maturation factor